MNHFTAIYEKTDNWWIGYVEELPGANTQGKTLEETRNNLREAVKLIIEANKKISRREYSGKKVIKEDLDIAV
jgi:predicted RNase H-like HicB family nuclease